MKTTKTRIIGFILALAMLTSLLPMTIFASEDLYETVAELKCDVAITETVEYISDGATYFKFIPEEDGEYMIYSTSETDPCATLLDSDGNYIMESDDENGRNFCIKYSDFVAGNTYYLKVSDYDIGAICTITVKLSCNGNHFDTDEDNICDACMAWVDADFTIIPNVTMEVPYTTGATVLKFIPEVSGKYNVYSSITELTDPYVSVRDALGELVAENDDDEDYNFSCYFEAVAGEVYFIEVGQYYEEATTPTTLVLVCDHKDSIVSSCLGNICTKCDSTFGESDPNAHILDSTQTCLGYKCLRCYNFIGEANPDAHIYDDGTCTLCSVEHDDHVFDEKNACTVCMYQLYAFSVTTNYVTAYYETFEEALEAATDGSTVKLLKNVYLSDIYYISEDITIDMNGYCICESDNAILYLTGAVTLIDSFEKGIYYADVYICNADVKLINGIFSFISFENVPNTEPADFLGGCSYYSMLAFGDATDLEGVEQACDVAVYVWGYHQYSDWETVKEATETENGIKEHCCEVCGYTETEEFEAEKDDTTDSDTDVDTEVEPEEAPEEECDHMCHESGIRAIIWRIISLIYKIFGINSVCDCGELH